MTLVEDVLNKAWDLADMIRAGSCERAKASRAVWGKIKPNLGADFGADFSLGVDAPRALMTGTGDPRYALQEVPVLYSLVQAGFRPVIYTRRGSLPAEIYRRLGCREIVYRPLRHKDLKTQAHRLLGTKQSVHEVLKLTSSSGVSVGRYALSSLMRATRSGDPNLSEPSVRAQMHRFLAQSLQAAQEAVGLLDRVRPSLLLVQDRGYSPIGELFDEALIRGIPVYTWNVAHKNNAIILKRYTNQNRDAHPASLDPLTWQNLQRESFSEQDWQRLRQEWESCYASGEWYGEVGTQTVGRLTEKDLLIGRLGLDPQKKTAVIFSHIFWDATFFWGEDLFRNYEDWFIQVVQAAMANPRLNWIVKVHPANLVKDRRDRYAGEHAEVLALRKIADSLPPHIKVLPAQTEISTYGLFTLMDYCFTVRGTVGVEAACQGVLVLTAGTGRYDRHGFTVDFASPAELLNKIAQLPELPPLTPAQTELARRYAAGVFLRRPVALESIRMEFSADAQATLQVELLRKTRHELLQCPDIKKMAAYFRSGETDYLESQISPE